MNVLLPHPLSGLFSDRRARVLDVLLTADASLSGREVAKRAGVAPTTAADALGELRERGMAQAEPRGRAVLWRVAPDSVLARLLSEWAAGADADAARIVRNRLGESARSVVIFGSTARGDENTDSDVDVLVVAADRSRRRHYRRQAAAIARDLRSLLGRPVEVVVMDVDELRERASTRFVEQVARDGRMLDGTPVDELVTGMVA